MNFLAAETAEKIARIVDVPKAKRYAKKVGEAYASNDSIAISSDAGRNPKVHDYLQRRSDDFNDLAERHNDARLLAKNPWIVGRESYRSRKAEWYSAALLRESMKY